MALGLIGLTVSDIGYDDSTSTGALVVGGATVAAATALRGVPSTGQKLNRSANCSWHVLQNFILTTSLSRWGSSELKLPIELIDWLYEAAIRSSKDPGASGAFHLLSKTRSSSSCMNLESELLMVQTLCGR